MRCLTVIVLYMLLASFTSLSAQGAPGEESENKSEFSIVGKNEGHKYEDFRFQMGESLQIKATGELVEDLCEISPCLSLDRHGRNEELQVHIGHPFPNASNGLFERDAKVLFFVGSLEFCGDRRRHLLADQVESRRQAVAGA